MNLQRKTLFLFPVISTYREPIKAWIDNIYGPTGLLIGTGMGVIRVILVNDKYKADIVPVDYVINGLIAASYKTATEKWVSCSKKNVCDSDSNVVSGVNR